MNVIQTIAKNTLFLTVSQVITLIFAFFYTVYAARYLGAEEFGVLSFAISFIAIFSVFTDLGLNVLTVRDVSQDKKLLNRYVDNIIPLKLILVFIVLVLVFIIINLLNYPFETIKVVYIIALYIGFTSIIGFFNSIFQIYEKIEYQSIGNILNHGIIFIGTLVAIYYRLDVIGFAFIYLISSLIVLIYSYFICKYKFVLPTLKIDYSFWKSKIKKALPFGITSMFTVIYFRIDIVMLSILQGNEVVGFYSVAYKLLDVFTMLIVVSTAQIIFPVISRYFKSEKLKDIFIYLFKITFYVSLLLTIFTILFSNQLILFIYGIEYKDAIMVLQILMLAFFVMSISSISSLLLNSVQKQKIVAIGTGICAVFNIVLNLILIPLYSLNGAAFATLLTELLGFLIYFYSVSKYLSLNKRDSIKIIKISKNDVRYFLLMLFPTKSKKKMDDF